MGLDKLKVKIKYKSFLDDPIREFYIPVLSDSIVYKRAVGYFSSSILVDYVKGLRGFYKNNGFIQLIISPYLSEPDKDSIEKAHSLETTKELINSLFISFLDNVETFTSAKLLFLLIKNEKLSIKIAEPKKTSGLFHDKIGIFEDKEGNKIAISGSNNETSSAANSNVESFNTFCSWKSGQLEYVSQHELDFDDYWNGFNPFVTIYSMHEAIDKSILERFETDETESDLLDLLMSEENDDESTNFHVKPYHFQSEAVDAWFKNKRGIFKFATGSGKTKTAIYLMEKLESEKLQKFFIIVVPDKTLVNQWGDELESYDKNVLKCFSANPDWNIKLKDFIEITKLRRSQSLYVVVTNDSYSTPKFQRELKKLNDDYLLVIDECHTWGTENFLNNVPDPTMRLGLSATPELFYSEFKTERLLNFLGGIIAEYSLEDAINEKKLVGYNYYPHFVSLTSEEKNRYDELTKKIVKMIGHDTDEMSDKHSKYGDALELLLFTRARIVYGASKKLDVLKDIVPALLNGGNLIVYCGPTSHRDENDVEKESLTQLETVNKALGKIGIPFAQYTSKESEDERKSALHAFKTKKYSALVAIKCLDEGVNIPQIEKAVIMASSTNPREFIQRRGRILRTNPGKEVAEIHDIVVFDEEYPNLCAKELNRVNEFSKLAINREKMISGLPGEISKKIKEIVDDETRKTN